MFLNMDVEKATDPWSTSYFAVLCLENVFSACATSSEGGILNQLGAHSNGLTKKLLLLTTKHDNYWVRLSCQRLFGFMFGELTNQKSKKKVTLNSLFGLESERNDKLKLIYQFESVLRYS